MTVGHCGLFLTAVNVTVTFKTHQKWSILTWEGFRKSLRHSESSAAWNKEQSHFCCFEIEPLNLPDEGFSGKTPLRYWCGEKQTKKKNKQTQHLTVVPAFSCVLATASSWKRNTCFAIVATVLLQRAVCIITLTVDVSVEGWAVWTKNSSTTPLPPSMINYFLGSIRKKLWKQNPLHPPQKSNLLMKLKERGASVGFSFSHLCERNNLILDLLSRDSLISSFMRGIFSILKATNAYDQVTNLLSFQWASIFTV